MPSSSSASKSHARSLRREQTEVERTIWYWLRARRFGGAKFRRQFPIGEYVVDFCCWEQRLVVEIDGGQHSDQTAADQKRTEFLTSRGFRILRFWNNDVLANREGVLQKILEVLGTSCNENPSHRPGAD